MCDCCRLCNACSSRLIVVLGWIWQVLVWFTGSQLALLGSSSCSLCLHLLFHFLFPQLSLLLHDIFYSLRWPNFKSMLFTSQSLRIWASICLVLPSVAYGLYNITIVFVLYTVNTMILWQDFTYNMIIPFCIENFYLNIKQ